MRSREWFRKGKSCVEQIFVIRIVVEYSGKGKKVEVGQESSCMKMVRVGLEQAKKECLDRKRCRLFP